MTVNNNRGVGQQWNVGSSDNSVSKLGRDANTTLHNVHHSQKAAASNQSLVRAVRSNAVSTNKAAIALKNVAIGPSIKADTPAAASRPALASAMAQAAPQSAASTDGLTQTRQRGRAQGLGSQDDPFKLKHAAEKANRLAGQANQLAGDVIKGMRDECEKGKKVFDLASPSIPKTFMRGNAGPIKAIDALVKPPLAKAAAGAMVDIQQTFTNGLKKAGSSPSKGQVEDAAIATHKVLLKRLETIQAPPMFGPIAKALCAKLDEAADAQATGATPEKQNEIRKNIAETKKNVVSALLLRTFFADLGVALSTNSPKPAVGATQAKSGADVAQFKSEFEAAMAPWDKEFKSKVDENYTKGGVTYHAAPKANDFSAIALRHLNMEGVSAKVTGLAAHFEKFNTFVNSPEGNAKLALGRNPAFAEIIASLDLGE